MVVSLTAALALLPSWVLAAPTDTETTPSTTPEAGSDDLAATSAPAATSETPSAGATQTVTAPDATPTPKADPTDPVPEAPVTSSAPESPTTSQGIDETLLEADEAATAKPPTPPPSQLRSSVEGEGAEDAALAREFDQRYRPADNPGRFNLTLHTLFANAGGEDEIGGRMGGIQADVGQTFNRFGYGITASVWGGRVFLPERTGAEMNALFGVGPTVGLGRLALLGRGFLDLRVGYDVYYGVVNERRDDTRVVAQTPGQVTLTQTENLIPHGPRVRLDMGLLSLADRNFFHGFGFSAGYQGLVHSLRGELPFTHMLTLGLVYWMG